MVLARQGFWVGVIAAGLVSVGSLAAGQASQAQQQQQQVPDAPKPQALPNLNTITPIGAALPANASTSSTPAAPDANAPGTSLPSTPAPTAAAQEDAQQGPAPVAHASNITVHTNLVEIPFTVKDSHGQLVPGITWRDVRVFENGVRVPRLAMFSTDSYPLSVALVIDQSVTFDIMEKINNSLHALQGAFTPVDSVAVFTYNNGVREQTALTGAQSARLTAVLEQSKGKGRDPVLAPGGPLSQTTMINNKQVDPNTAPLGMREGQSFQTPEKEFHTLNDAILEAAKSLTRVSPTNRRIVYVISDGKEYGSTAKEKAVIAFCQTYKVQVYATLVGDSAIPGVGFLDRIHLPLTMQDNALPRYVSATGGQMDYEFRQGGIERSFARIAEESRTQYTLDYYSHEPVLDGKYRKVEVQVMRPSLQITAPQGYFPTPVNTAPMASTPSAIP